ncbi:MAG: hypothetical protein A2845_05385 [Candidatus Lloydbacteria bacterium RIFCSPHIGHO2_01_FULL_49_22]|uniref:DUF805 domain-containing protein n=1 Tax=Candidatus Lloydbacteria bacterium RIFCSPHIGHO2_01_FULL_49_22 TaxID=1798658 RepID=A0A1G2CTI1_9BACT|nr:MAG: hypothetical protein A2845_05385 [Candidatus Lloydbacteria bacterium RIFCSPHIGHO2_01_FULL_49_22]OGZ09145.1 MAG: hypothetical protein A3C14_04130 [Candidatus Lloydbacteria bacterium RIFCSPHIGHO2_02_FULL_50_18]
MNINIKALHFLGLPIKREIYTKAICSLFGILILFFVVLVVVPSVVWQAVPYLLWAIIIMYVFYIGIALIVSFYLISRRLKTLGYSTLWMILMFFPIFFVFVVLGLMAPSDEKIVYKISA